VKHRKKPAMKAESKSLVDMNWTNEQKQRFEEICGTEMERAGYSLTEHYFNH